MFVYTTCTSQIVVDFYLFIYLFTYLIIVLIVVVVVVVVVDDNHSYFLCIYVLSQGEV